MSEYLEAVEGRIREGGFDGEIRRKVVSAGQVVPALLAHVEEGGADLAVMTSHGRGPLGRAWLGSTADGFIRSTLNPTLLLRPSEDITEEVNLGERPPAFSRVLVPLDGSPASERIVPLVEGVAGPDRAMILLRAVPPFHGGDPFLPHVVDAERHYEAALDAARTDLTDVAEAMDGGAKPRVEVRRIHPARAILDVAEENGVDLIAMSTAGRGGVRRLLLGSVADKVVRGTTIPLLLYRGTAAEA